MEVSHGNVFALSSNLPSWVYITHLLVTANENKMENVGS